MAGDVIRQPRLDPRGLILGVAGGWGGGVVWDRQLISEVVGAVARGRYFFEDKDKESLFKHVASSHDQMSLTLSFIYRAVKQHIFLIVIKLSISIVNRD